MQNFTRIEHSLLMAVIVFHSQGYLFGESLENPHVIATTDGEVDDRCSMVRFLLYANEWDIKGLIYSSSVHHWKINPKKGWHGEHWTEKQIDAYAQVCPSLLKHDKGYPSPEYLKKQVFVGNISVTGDMKEATPGSERIGGAYSLCPPPRTGPGHTANGQRQQNRN